MVAPLSRQRAVLSNPGDPVVLARGSIANAYLYGGDARSLIENANGGSGDDVLIGNDADNVLTGNDGDDTLRYTGGHDTLLGGRSRVAGDTADFSLSPVGVTISPTATFVTTHLLNGQVVQIPIFEGSSSADDSAHAYSASTFTEVGPIPLADLRGIENLTGSPFADTITGNIADNTIHAGRGDDTVFYTGGFDSLDGGPGNNTVNFSSFSSAVDMTLRSLGSFPEAFTSDGSTIAPNSTLRPIANLLNFSNAVGTPFGDHLQGNSGNNTLDGGGGDDVLFYNGGIDVLNGNTGNDTADFSLFDSAVSVDLTSTGFDAQSNGTTSVLTGNFSGIASLQSIENVNGTNFNDVLHGDGNANVINAEAGIDTAEGGFGNDPLIGGGDVNDTISYQSHDGQALLGQQATISLGLNGADGSYTRSGFTKAGPITFESDVLRGFQNVIGSTQSEIINGNEQDNRFVGRGGNDTINGGAGNDTYDLTGPAAASVGSNTFFDQSGTDNVRINFFSNVTSASRVGNDLVVGLTNGSFRVVNHFAGNPIENLTTFDGQSITLSISNIGGNGSGLIAGGNGGETLDGRGGDDFLFGGNGPDRIIGGDGNDHLTGGNGPAPLSAWVSPQRPT